MSNKICLVWGGTGGHVVPILSLVANLSPSPSKGEGWGEVKQFFWIGGKESMEQEKAHDAGIRFIPITTYKLTSTKSLGVFLYPFKLMQGIWEARKILKIEQPKLVFSKGGPGSVAVGIAAWSMKIPLYIHESDTVPGFSNKILSYFATRVFLGFKEASRWFRADKTTVVGQILHPQFSLKNPTGNIEWKTDKKHVFVSCGSQGSRKVFQTLIEQRKQGLSPLSLGEAPRRAVGVRVLWSDTEWIISLGTLNTNMRAEFEKWEHTQIFDWIAQEDIPHILDETDIAITRASATTLAELATRPIHLIIIPLAISAGNHQLTNARVYEKMGHTVILESDLAKSDISEILESSFTPWEDNNSRQNITPLLEIFSK